MTKLIDANDFMRRLTLDTGKGHYGEFMDGSEVAFTSREIAAFVEQMPTLTPPNEWISVEDRLPEPGDLIVYADNTVWGYQYGICRVCGKEKAFDYWIPLQDPPNNRPPEGGEDT